MIFLLPADKRFFRSQATNTSRLTANDAAWPVASFWLGLQNIGGTWQWDDLITPAYIDGSMWNLAISPFGGGTGSNQCVGVTSPNVTAPACTTQATSLFCQNRPSRNKWCPYPWRLANSQVCYTQPPGGPVATNSYAQALAACAAVNGTLPSWHNLTEYMDFFDQIKLVMVLQNQPLQQSGAWIGLNNTNGDGKTWTWSDGTTFDWNNWNQGAEPKAGKQCTVADFSFPNYDWRSEDCSQTNNYLVLCQTRTWPLPTSKLGLICLN